MIFQDLKGLDPAGYIATQLPNGKWALYHDNDPEGYVCKRKHKREFGSFDAIITTLQRAEVLDFVIEVCCDGDGYDGS